jgi:SAM-dependent methyltransferase
MGPDVLARITALANAPRRDRGVTRAVYSYPAKFQAHLPAELIRLFTSPGDLVVDPYAGGGTTGLEAFLLGRRFFGVDINPFACLVARVKTTPVDPTAVARTVEQVLAGRAPRAVLDDDDARCLGERIAGEVARLAGASDAVAGAAERDLVRLALVHAVKIAGRRDFADDSIIPLFLRRVATISKGLEQLPASGHPPRFREGSCHALPELPGGSARLVVTSPPYKDLDVEYGLLQIQRRDLGKSKRSRVIWNLLGAPVQSKIELCGGRGATYWSRLAPALREIRRVLAPGAPAFFWTGFKTDGDRDAFVARLAEAGLPARHLVPVSLSGDRVASSRSTHHGRATGMMARDYLICCL